MATADDFFPSKSLKAADIKDKEPVLTITEVTNQEFDDGMKPIIHFEETPKTLVCNRTNWNAIVDITGQRDSDRWAGKRIKLVVARVDYQGKRVDAIRVDEPPTRKTVDQPDDDSITF